MKLTEARGLVGRIAALAGVLAALVSCQVTGSSQLHYVIRVDSIAAPIFVAPSDTVRVRFHGSVGPDGCWRLDKVDRQRDAGTLEVTFRGAYEQHLGEDCTKAVVALSYEELVPPPRETPFTITVHQPDATILQHRVTQPPNCDVHASEALSTAPAFTAVITRLYHESAFGPAGFYSQYNVWVAIPPSLTANAGITVSDNDPIFERALNGSPAPTSACALQVGSQVEIWHDGRVGYGSVQAPPGAPAYFGTQLLILR